MAVIYGWTYAQFHANIGWGRGDETVYDFWENYWATQIDSYIFSDAGTHLTDADEMKEIQTLVNSMMFQMNSYLKADHNEKPMQAGFFGIGFPYFVGSPLDNKGMGSGNYEILNKYKRKYDTEFARADSIMIGIDPANIYFGVRGGGRFY